MLSSTYLDLFEVISSVFWNLIFGYEREDIRLFTQTAEEEEEGGCFFIETPLTFHPQNNKAFLSKHS